MTGTTTPGATTTTSTPPSAEQRPYLDDVLAQSANAQADTSDPDLAEIHALLTTYRDRQFPRWPAAVLPCDDHPIETRGVEPMNQPTRPLSRLLLLTAVLATLATGAQAQEVYNGGTGRTVLGGALTAGGIAMIPITTEYQLVRWDPGMGFLVLTIPCLLAPGIPTLVLGISQLAEGSMRLHDPANLELYGRAQAGALAFPYLLAGSLVGGIGLGLALAMDATMTFNGPPAVIAPILGFAMLGTGIMFAADGDAAARQLWGREDLEQRPGEFLLGGGVTLLSVGTALLAGMAPAVRQTTYGTGHEVAPVVGVAGTGAALMGGGIAMLAVGSRHLASSYRDAGSVTAMHRARTVHLDGFAPYHDPHTQTTGLALVGRF